MSVLFKLNKNKNLKYIFPLAYKLHLGVNPEKRSSTLSFKSNRTIFDLWRIRTIIKF